MAKNEKADLHGIGAVRHVKAVRCAISEAEIDDALRAPAAAGDGVAHANELLRQGPAQSARDARDDDLHGRKVASSG